MSLMTIPDERLCVHQPRHCISPEGSLLTWLRSPSTAGWNAGCIRLRNDRIPDAFGEALRVEWGGTPD